jgi:HEPN domain-containing protein
MARRAADWLAQAEHDLELAELAAAHGRHEWACFAAQQAAEKAVKALHLHLGQVVWGHAVTRLLEELPREVPEVLRDAARRLDAYYIAPRYPDAFVEGPPARYFGRQQAEEAIRYARAILDFVRAAMAEPGGSTGSGREVGA